MSNDLKNLEPLGGPPNVPLSELTDRLKRAESEIQRLRDRLIEFEKTIRNGEKPKVHERQSRRRAVTKKLYAM